MTVIKLLQWARFARPYVKQGVWGMYPPGDVSPTPVYKS